ncbi:MAG: GTP 3',8-cyclase MoaA [Desulfobacterales bacterium]
MGMTTMPLVDSFQRRVSYLRISVTDRCNLRCRYCAPSRPLRIEKSRLLTLEEIYRLAEIGVDIGIRKIRLTGGEPLCRNGIVDLIERLCRIRGLKDVSLTTNGTMISRMAGKLREAGVGRINISLDTLDPEKFHRLTGADLFGSVWDGIQAAAKCGFDPIKINTVVMKGVNDDEIERLAGLSLEYPFHVRFIEYMPIGTDPLTARRHFVPLSEIKAKVEALGRLEPVEAGRNDGPAVRYRLEGAPGEIGLIGSMSSHFCGTCNRIRLTADGHLRPCLLADEQVDVISPLRRGGSDDELKALFRAAMARKREEHRLDFKCGSALQSRMFRIGG